MNSLNKTFLPTKNYKNRNWFLIDCKGQTLGRLATIITALLKGKIKPHYHPSIDTGDYIVLINADSIILNENKDENEDNQSRIEFLTITLDPYNNIAIEELQLSVRAYNCLKKAQIDTVGDLLQYSPKKLQELRNFGRKSADEVFSTLKNKLGITLK